ncbi:DDB1- and CUL4-associated factor 8, partial [Pseudolycoriella hygida]
DSSDGTSSLASTVPATVSSPFENSDSHRSGSSRSNAPPSNSDSESDHVPFRPHTVVEGLTNAIIRKQKSKYQWFSVPSIMHRQNGFSAGKKLRHVADSRNFSAAFCGSLHAVERMELMASLRGHNKCVNCLNFNRNGKLLASGSDDLKIKIWDWARQKAIVAIKTSHTANIYQTKFVDYKACTDINFDIVSSDQRGDVRYFSVSPCGSVRVNKLLVSKSRPIHSLGLPANCPNEVLLAAQDCSVMLIDLREDRTSELVRSSFPLYCLSCHPLDSNIFCVGGRKEFIQIYDRRKGNIPTRSLCPVHLEKKPDSMISVTSVVYNYTGNEILASYAAENIYLFDSSKEKMGRVLHRYSGHRNIRTIKGVEFYGPRSEFIISGSEYPGHLFFWEKQTEAIVQMFNADSGGILNCLEPHPSLPVIATSGLSNSVKLWYPASTTEPNFMHLRSDVFRNVNYVLNRRNRNTELDIFQFILQRMRRRNAAEVDNQPIDFGSESDSSSEHETESVLITIDSGNVYHHWECRYKCDKNDTALRNSSCDYRTIRKLLHELENKKDIVIFKGSGKVFCAGGDHKRYKSTCDGISYESLSWKVGRMIHYIGHNCTRSPSKSETKIST